MQTVNHGLCLCVVCVCMRVSEAGCWPLSRRRRQDSVLVQTLREEGAGSVVVRNGNRMGGGTGLLAFHLHADGSPYHYIEGRCSY